MGIHPWKPPSEYLGTQRCVPDADLVSLKVEQDWHFSAWSEPSGPSCADTVLSCIPNALPWRLCGTQPLGAVQTGLVPTS